MLKWYYLIFLVRMGHVASYWDLTGSSSLSFHYNAVRRESIIYSGMSHHGHEWVLFQVAEDKQSS